eukprot:scaffold8943_cov28-Prasinocladus_malaysianus.AAC.1
MSAHSTESVILSPHVRLSAVVSHGYDEEVCVRSAEPTETPQDDYIYNGMGLLEAARSRYRDLSAIASSDIQATPTVSAVVSVGYDEPVCVRSDTSTRH